MKNYNELKTRLDVLAEEIPEKKAEKVISNKRKAENYKQSFWNAMQTGIYTNSLNEGSVGSGAFLVPDTYESKIVAGLTENNLMRQLAKVIETNKNMDIPVVEETATATWVPENSLIHFTDVKYGKITLGAYKLAQKTIVSDEMLEDTDFDLESYILQSTTESIAKAEEEAFFNGDGNGKPLGIIHQAEVGTVTANAGEITFDDIINLIHSVKESYRNNAVFIMSPTAEIMLHKEMHHHGRSPWDNPLAKGEPKTLFGHKVYISNNMEDAESGKTPVIFGDFSYFLIGERANRTIKRLSERYADRGQVAYISSERVDAKLLDSEAVKTLKIATA